MDTTQFFLFFLVTLLKKSVDIRHVSIRFTPEPENRPLHEGHPPQGLFEARRAGSFFKIFILDPPRGLPVGVGDIYR